MEIKTQESKGIGEFGSTSLLSGNINKYRIKPNGRGALEYRYTPVEINRHNITASYQDTDIKDQCFFVIEKNK